MTTNPKLTKFLWLTTGYMAIAMFMGIPGSLISYCLSGILSTILFLLLIAESRKNACRDVSIIVEPYLKHPMIPPNTIPLYMTRINEQPPSYQSVIGHT